MSEKPICDICGGEVDGWRGKGKPRHERDSLCLASALLRLAAAEQKIEQLSGLAEQANENIFLRKEIERLYSLLDWECEKCGNQYGYKDTMVCASCYNALKSRLAAAERECIKLKRDWVEAEIQLRSFKSFYWSTINFHPELEEKDLTAFASN